MAALHSHVSMPVGRRVCCTRPLRALLHETHCGDLEAAMAMGDSRSGQWQRRAVYSCMSHL